MHIQHSVVGGLHGLARSTASQSGTKLRNSYIVGFLMFPQQRLFNGASVVWPFEIVVAWQVATQTDFKQKLLQAYDSRLLPLKQIPSNSHCDLCKFDRSPCIVQSSNQHQDSLDPFQHASKSAEKLLFRPILRKTSLRTKMFGRTLQTPILPKDKLELGETSRIVQWSNLVWPPQGIASFSATSSLSPKYGIPCRAKCNMGWAIQPPFTCQPNSCSISSVYFGTEVGLQPLPSNARIVATWVAYHGARFRHIAANMSLKHITASGQLEMLWKEKS